MKTFLYLFLSLIILLYISPFFSLYKIGTSIRKQDTQTLNNYMDWPSLQESLKKDVKSFLKDREKLRENGLDNPIEGIFEDVKKFGGLLFGQKAISIAIDKVVSPEGVFKLYKLANKPKKSGKNTKTDVDKTDIVKSGNIFQYDGYALTNFNFITLSDLEATISTSDADVYFKMKFIFPRWILYTVKSETLTNEIAKKVEDKIDLLKNLNRKINPLKK